MYNNICKYDYLTGDDLDHLIKDKSKKYEMPVWINSKENQYKYFNDKFLQLLNIEDEDNLSKEISIILGDENLSKIKDIRLKIMNSGEKNSFNEYIYVNGKEMIWRVTAIPIFHSNNECDSCLCIAKVSYKKYRYAEKCSDDGNQHSVQYNIFGDDSDRKEGFIYEELYEYMQEIYDSMIVCGMSIWTCSSKFKIIKKKVSIGVVNEVFDGVDLPLDDFLQEYLIRNCDNMFYPVPLKSYSKTFADYGFKQEYEKKLENKYIIYTPIVYDNTLLGVLNLYFDKMELSEWEYRYIRRVAKRISLCLKNIQLLHNVTEQLQEKIQLQNSLSRYLNNSLDVCIILDKNFNILTTSYNLIGLLGWSFEELRHSSIFKIFDQNHSITNMEKKYNTKVYAGPHNAKCKNGNVKSIDVYYYVDSVNEEIVLTGQDLTNINELRAKTEFLQKEIKREKGKSEFICNISHEFRTPLNIILSSIQLEELKNRNKIIKSYGANNLEIIKQNSYRLLRLSNNIIDITSINSNCLEVELRNNNIISDIRELLQYIDVYCKKIRRKFIYNLDSKNITIACDREKLQKVVLNLLSNAIKATQVDGTIELGIDINREENRVYIWVEDDGCGIPEEKYFYVFSMFTQIGDVLNRRSEGSGIGLAICKAFVEVHGGKIYIDKTTTKGTKVEFYIPINTIDKKYDNSLPVVRSSPATNVDIEFSDIYL